MLQPKFISSHFLKTAQLHSCFYRNFRNNSYDAVVAGLPASSRYPDGPALTGHLDTGFARFSSLKPNAQTVPNTASCYCVLLM
jgi:hypothetical protein